MNVAISLAILALAFFASGLATGSMTWSEQNATLAPALLLQILSFGFSVLTFALLAAFSFWRPATLTQHPVKLLAAMVLAAIPPIAFVFLMKF